MMKFIFKIVYSRFINLGNTSLSFKIILLEEYVRIEIFSIIDFFCGISSV